MACCVRNICAKNRQNLLILLKVTIDNVGVPFYWDTAYTMGHKKCRFIMDHNSHVSWWIVTLLVSTERRMNALQTSYKIYKFTSTVSLTKTKNTQNGTFWSQLSQYLNAQQQEWVYELSELFFYSSLLAENPLHYNRVLITIIILSSKLTIFHWN